MDLTRKKDFFFDIDKTLINWDETVIGAEDLIGTLKQKDKNVYFFTDNTLLSAQKYAEKLRCLGIHANAEDILTVDHVAAKTFKKRGVRSVYAIGNNHLIEGLEKHGIDTRKSSKNVLLGFDKQFNYQKVRRAKEVLSEGGQLYVCSEEKTLKLIDTEIPHQKALNNCLATFTDKEVKSLGKASDEYMNIFSNYFSFRPNNSLLVGDSLSDIELGNKMGMETAAVMSGEIDKNLLSKAENIQKPDYGVSNLTKITRKAKRL